MKILSTSHFKKLADAGVVLLTVVVTSRVVEAVVGVVRIDVEVSKDRLFTVEVEVIVALVAASVDAWVLVGVNVVVVSWELVDGTPLVVDGSSPVEAKSFLCSSKQIKVCNLNFDFHLQKF
jgi:hypothetical protein